MQISNISTLKIVICSVLCDTKLQTLVSRVADIHKLLHHPAGYRESLTAQRSKGCTCIKETESAFSCVEVTNKHYFSTKGSIDDIYLLMKPSIHYLTKNYISSTWIEKPQGQHLVQMVLSSS